ncbi:hypothetical protein CR513_14879, partial [Mucuna pruriens]
MRVDILGPFAQVVGQVKFLTMAIDYFTKWVEVESIITISVKQRIEKKSRRGQGEVGKGIVTSTLIIPYHPTLHHPENPIQINIWDRCRDPCRDRGALSKNHLLTTNQ